MIDLAPAAQRMSALLAGVSDGNFARPTPCPGMQVGDLVDHIRRFTVTFTGVARKQPGRGGQPSAADLPVDWRDALPAALDALAAAWRAPEAWEGMTSAGGVDVPGQIAGLIALDELVLHGWDLAVATGQSYDAPVDEVEAAMSFATSVDAPRDGGLFGPVVPVPADAPLLRRLLGLAGRDPDWRSPAT